MLHTVTFDGKRRAWCGPVTVAAITGVSIKQVTNKYRRVRGSPRSNVGHLLPIKSTFPGETQVVLARLGWKVTDKKHNATGTLSSFCKDCEHMTGAFVVRISGHVMAFANGQLCDTYTHGKPVAWAEYPKLMSRVKEWWRLEGSTRVPADRARPPKPPRDIKRERFEKAQKALLKLERRHKRLGTLIKKRRAQVRRYEKIFKTN